MSTETEMDPVGKALAECKKYAGKTTDQALRFFINNYFIPTLNEMRDEYLAALPEDEEDEEDEAAFATLAINLVQVLSSLLDASFKASGWMSETEITDKIPAEIKGMYLAAREDLAEFGEASKELYSVVAAGEEDGGGDEDEDGGNTVVTLKPVPATPAGGAA